MTRQGHNRFWGLLAGVLVGAAFCQAEPTVTATHVWTPDTALAKRLAPPMSAQGFLLRPPRGYARKVMPLSDHSGTAVVWQRSSGNSSVKPTLIVVIREAPAALREQDEDAALKGMTETMSRGMKNVTVQSPEHGRIGALPAAHVRWHGTLVTDGGGTAASGFGYSVMDGSALAVVVGLSNSQDERTQIPLLEASALTLRRDKIIQGGTK